MADNTLVVESREGTGKGVARKLRNSGRVPAVFYVGGQPATPIQLDPRLLEASLRHSAAGLNTLFDLEGAGLDGKLALIKELQRDPVKGFIVHADLYAVDVKQTLQVSVPVHASGTPVGVSMEGGILDQALREVEVECLPRAIPEELLVDVSALGIGDSIHVGEIPLPEGVSLISDPELPVVSVVAPAKPEEEEVEAAEAEAAAEGEAAEGAEPGAEGEGESSGEEKKEE